MKQNIKELLPSFQQNLNEAQIDKFIDGWFSQYRSTTCYNGFLENPGVEAALKEKYGIVQPQIGCLL